MDAKDLEIARLREELDQAQHEVDEVLESTKDIEIQLEQDIALAEQQLQKVRRRNDDLTYDLARYKELFAQAQIDHEKEISSIQEELESANKLYTDVRDRLREEESKHDDLERQERIVTTSYQDLEHKYHAALEKNADLESEIESRNSSNVECQRLKDEIRDLESELAVMKLATMNLNTSERSKQVSSDTHSPEDSNMSHKKHAYFLTSRTAAGTTDRPPTSESDRPPSRLATSNSVRHIQSLSTTIATLKEKMRAAKELSKGDSWPSALVTSVPRTASSTVEASEKLRALPLPKTPIKTISEAIRSVHDSENHRPSSINVKQQAGAASSSPRLISIKSPVTRQHGTLPRALNRQSMSTLVASSPTIAKYESMSSIRSPNRRRSMLPSVVSPSSNKAQSVNYPKIGVTRGTSLKRSSYLEPA